MLHIYRYIKAYIPILGGHSPKGTLLSHAYHRLMYHRFMYTAIFCASVHRVDWYRRRLGLFGERWGGRGEGRGDILIECASRRVQEIKI